MPRIRTIKPDHPTHRKVGALTDRQYRLWIGMITQADDEGRLVWSPDQLRVLLFGYQDKTTVAMVQEAGARLAEVGLIRLYGYNGVDYADFPSWHDHQRISHPVPSIFPAYDDSGVIQKIPESGGYKKREGKGREGNGVEGKGMERKGGAADAAGIIAWLNAKAGRTYRAKGANLELVKARLADGIEAWQLKAIVSRKVREWQGDAKMRHYLRPETLFNKTKCEQYLGELPAQPEEEPA